VGVLSHLARVVTGSARHRSCGAAPGHVPRDGAQSRAAWSRRRNVKAWFGLALAGLITTGFGARAPAAAPSLTLDRVTGLPRLSGTAPQRVAWSPDGRRVAFLWNDVGMPFLDVWTADTDEARPRRVTQMMEHAGDGQSGCAAEDRSTTRRAERSGISEIVWTPEGTALIFLFDCHLHRVSLDGAALTRLTTTPVAWHSLSYSPDGRFLSYIEAGDVWLWHQNSGDHIRISRVGRPPIGLLPGSRFSRPDAEIVSYTWSGDGQHMALLAENRTKVRQIEVFNYLADPPTAITLRRSYPGDNEEVRSLGIYDTRGGGLRWIDLDGTRDRWIGSYRWSPDGTALLVDQHSEDAVDRWLYIVAASPSVPPRELLHERRDTRVSWHWTSTWRSDGKAVLFVSDRDGRHRLYALDLNGAGRTLLTPGDWSVLGESGAAWVAVDSARREVLFVATKKSPYERHVYRMPETGGIVREVTRLAGTHVPHLAPGGEALALLHSSDLSPPDLYLLDLKPGASERRLTRSPPQEFDSYPWIAPRYVTFPSHTDGVTLHGRLLVPHGLDQDTKRAAILGPVYPNSVRNRWADREEWRGLYSSFQQFLVLARGYVVLQVDVRGSVGYGSIFQERLLQSYGGIDVDDLESGARYLKTLGFVDPERIGIWGSSYGGLMAAMSLMRKPGLYRAGVAAAPATDVRHATPHEVRVLRRPEAYPEVYRRSSVIEYGEDLRDPLLILHGMHDDIVLFQDSVALAEKLMRLGKKFDLVVAPSAVHTWSDKPYVAQYLLGRIVDFFDRHLRSVEYTH
jgi:dipeptidyl-peptidase-4